MIDIVRFFLPRSWVSWSLGLRQGPQRYPQLDARHDVHMALARDLRAGWGSSLRGPVVPQPSVLWGYWLPTGEDLSLVDPHSTLPIHSFTQQVFTGASVCVAWLRHQA